MGVREKTKEATKQAIIRSAVNLISKDGFQSFTMNKITKGAGIAQPSFYVHFKNIAELLLEIIKLYEVSDEVSLKEVHAAIGDGDEADINQTLDKYIAMRLDMAVKFPELFCLITSQVSVLSEPLREILKIQHEKNRMNYAEVIKLYLASKGIKPNSSFLKMNIDSLLGSQEALVLGYIEGRYKNKKQLAQFMKSSFIDHLASFE